MASEFYVYILRLDGRQFYAGQTRDLRARLMEHREGGTSSTAGRNPKLAWFDIVSTRDEATTVEARLKGLIDRNPREIRKMVIRFSDLLKEVDR
jgi:predicted GIY-YIG superfamily endonuclease